MTKGPRIFDSGSFENWYLYNDSFRRSDGVRLLTDTPECKEFFWHFRPHTNDYSSSLNPVFLAEIPNLETLGRRPVWLVRDGWVPLLWFFRNYPKPENLKTKIFVHEDLLSVVPSAWAKHFGSYRLVSHFMPGIKPKTEPLRFIFTGLVTDSICSIDFLKDNLQRLKKQFGSALDKAEKTFCFFVRQDGYFAEDQSPFQVQFLATMAREIGENFYSISLEELKALSNLNGIYFCDFNERRIIADSYLQHLCASKGALMLRDGQIAQMNKLNKNERYVPLSPYHGMIIRDNIVSQAGKFTAEIDQEIERVMMSGSNQRYPWPRWLVEWSRETNLQ